MGVDAATEEVEEIWAPIERGEGAGAEAAALIRTIGVEG